MQKLRIGTAVTLMFLSLILAGHAIDDPTNDETDEIEEKLSLASFNIEEYQDYFRVIIILIAVCLFKIFYPRLPYVPDYIPQSLLLIAIGVIFGAIHSQLGKVLEGSVYELTPSLFFHFLLPPIVLDASFGLCNRTFFDFLGSILIYAVLGTIINFLLIGFLMFGIQEASIMGADMFELKSFLLFASLIVAVDPVAVLAIFEEIGVEPGLYYMVFGESLLNDAVTVVLYRIMSQFVGLELITAGDIGIGVGSFFTISIGGLLVGIVFGVVTSFLTRWKSHFSSVFVILMAYFSYIMGDCLGWSGIIAMIGCALVQAEYSFHNMSESALTTLRKIIKQIAEVAEGLIFFLIGIQLFSAEIEWNTGFCLWALVACLVARTLIVLFLSYIMNIVRVNKLKISFREQAILIYGGLRGAVAFALSLLIKSNTLGVNGLHIKKNIVTATLFIILVTVGLMGLTMKPLVRLFKVKLASEENLSIWQDLNENVLDHTLAGMESIIGSRGRNRLRRFFIGLDDKYFRKLLQRDPATHAEKIVKTYEEIALKLHFAAIRRSKSASHLRTVPELVAKQHMSTTEFPLHLPTLVLNVSEVNLVDVLNSAESKLSLEDEEGRRVTFPGSKDEEKIPNPNWTSRPSIADQKKTQEEFSSVFLGMMKKKSRFSKFHHSAARTQVFDEHTNRNTELNAYSNFDFEQNVKADTKHSSKYEANTYPARDYPAEMYPKFTIGDEH